MRCEGFRERIDGLWDGELPAEVHQHLTHCKPCRQYHRDLRWVRGGFHLLKGEEIPQPSLGFVERLMRQIGEMGKQPSVGEFFERVGRRFVYATLALTFLTLLAMALPATGPVRGLSAADIQMPAQEATLAYSDPMGESVLPENPDLAPVDSSVPPVTNEVK